MKNANRLSLKNNSHNNSRNSSSNHHLFNPDNTSIKQDLLFFKNDMLKDIRKFEEKLTTKLTEQSVANNDQYEACEKKLDIINSKIIRLNNFVSDNSDLSDKILYQIILIYLIKLINFNRSNQKQKKIYYL